METNKRQHTRHALAVVMSGLLTTVVLGCPEDDVDPVDETDGGTGTMTDGGSTGGTDGGSSGDVDGGAATGGMLIDCAFGAPMAEDPRCQASPGAGTIGSGPSLAQPGSAAEIGYGFIEGNQLIVPVGAILTGSSEPFNGAIFSIDLTTGDRTVVSGVVVDPRSGTTRTGEGEDLWDVLHVQKAPDGMYYALSRVQPGAYGGSTDAKQLTRIDPATGNREMVFRYPSEEAATNLCARFGRSLAFGPDGTVYTNFDNGGAVRGVLSMNPGTLECAVLSSSGDSVVGEGPDWGTGLRGLTYADGYLWLVDFNSTSLYRVDPATGNRLRVTSVAGTGGFGEGIQALGSWSLAYDGDTIWTAGRMVGTQFAAAGSAVVSVDVETGNRFTPDGSGDGPSHANDGLVEVYLHPTEDWLITTDNDSVLLVDTDPHRRNTLSN